MTPPRPTLVIDPGIQFGRVCVPRTRVPADALAECVFAGDTVADVAADYEVARIDVLAACWWSAQWGDVATARRGTKRWPLAQAWLRWAQEVAHPALAGWDGRDPAACPDPPTSVEERGDFSRA